MVCVHQDLRALWCILFSSFPIFFPQSVPKPIALEPCFGNKAAVLSIFVRLPRGTGGIPPPGQSGKTQPLKSFTCFSFLTCLFDWASLFLHHLSLIWLPPPSVMYCSFGLSRSMTILSLSVFFQRGSLPLSFVIQHWLYDPASSVYTHTPASVLRKWNWWSWFLIYRLVKILFNICTG